MKHKILVLCLSILFPLCGIVAQRENHNWLFGYNAGLTWNTTQNFNATGMFGTANANLSGIPTTIPSNISTNEGCFSISDADGQLLFYSDGITIWDRRGFPMPHANGDLTGHSSSAQSGIVVPYPGQPTKYIIFTLGERAADNLSYSVVNMDLNGGFGDVIEGEKNILLTGQSGILGESLTAVRHNNKKDIWVIAGGRGTSTYLNVWKIDEDGVQIVRHSVTSINIDTSTSISLPNGYITFSENGEYFTFNIYSNQFFIFGKFDNTIGQIATINARSRQANSIYGNGYGTAFSKSGKFLYLTNVPGNINNNIGSSLHVYDFLELLAAANPETVNPVKTINVPQSSSNGANDHFGAIVMGPDERLYASYFYSNSLYVITNPESPASMNIYKLSGLLGSGSLRWGLPTFMAPWFRVEIIPPVGGIACEKIANDYTLKIYGGEGFSDVKSIVIDWGDGSFSSRMVPPTTGSFVYSHAYDKVGSYTITVTPYLDIEETLADHAQIKTSVVKISRCIIPVNPNIHIFH